MVLLGLLAFVALVVCAVKVLRALSRRDERRHAQRPALLFALVLGGWWGVGHLGELHRAGPVLPYFLLASVATAAVMQIGASIGRVRNLPTWTLPLAACDAFLLAVITGSQYSSLASGAIMMWSLGFCAWLIALGARALGAGEVSRRRAEADEAIARMQAAERAAEGEVWR